MVGEMVEDLGIWIRIVRGEIDARDVQQKIWLVCR